MSPPIHNTHRGVWSRPEADHIKVNCDAAWQKESGKAGLGFVARDYNGEVLFSGARFNYYARSPLEAEEKDVHWAMSHALSRGWSFVKREGNRAAHSVASFALTCSYEITLDGSVPTCANVWMIKDVLLSEMKGSNSKGNSHNQQIQYSPDAESSRYEIGESSTARPIRGRGIDYGFVSTVDAEERRQGIRDVGYGIRDTWVDPAEAVPEIAPMTVGEVNTRVTELAELHEHDTQDLYALLEDAQDSRSRISQRVDMDSQRVDLLMGDRMTLQETVWMVEEEAYASREAWAHSIGLSQATHQELQTHRDHVRARQPGPEAGIPDHQDASGDADSHI
ncbi:retrovirus-related pol polyprotein from transposon TNT 1-94 [Tanacetum coccineum]